MKGSIKGFIKENPIVSVALGYFGYDVIRNSMHKIYLIVEDFNYHKSYREYLHAVGPETAGGPKRNRWKKEIEDEQTEQKPGSDEDELLGKSEEEDDV